MLLAAPSLGSAGRVRQTSAGLAAVLISFGLAMVYAGRFMSRRGARAPLTERWLPLASFAVIALVGVTIALRSLVMI